MDKKTSTGNGKAMALKSTKRRKKRGAFCTALILFILATAISGCVEKKTFDTKEGIRLEASGSDSTALSDTDSEEQEDVQAVTEAASGSDSTASSDDDSEMLEDVQAIAEAEQAATNIQAAEQTANAQDVQADEQTAQEKAGDGSVQFTLSSGEMITLKPAEPAAFKEQDDNVLVFTRIGTTVFKNGSELWAGSSAIPLSMMRNTETIEKPMISFSYEFSKNGEELAEDAIEEAGQNAVLSVGGEEYPVLVTWITKDLACFFFECDELPASLPVFSVSDGKLRIQFEDIEAKGSGGEPEPAEELGTALEEGTSFQWRDYDGSVARTDIGGITSGKFVLKPTGMTDDEYCLNLYILIDKEVCNNDELKDAFYAESVLVDRQGNTYAPRLNCTPTEDKDYSFLFLYAIPNDVAENDLRLTFQEPLPEQEP